MNNNMMNPMQPNQNGNFNNNVPNAYPMPGAPVPGPVPGPVPQPVPQPQPPVAPNGPMFNQPAPAPKKSGGSKFLLIGIIAVLLVAIVVMAVMLTKKDSGSKDSKDDNETTKEEAVVATTKVSFGGYEFAIPAELRYEKSTTTLTVTDDEETWLLDFVISSNAKYDLIKERQAQLLTNIKNAGYQATKVEVKKIKGVEFVVCEVSVGGTKGIFAYAKLDDTHTMCVTVQTVDNEFDYAPLDYASPIIASAKTYDSSNAIAPSKNLNPSNPLTNLN